jgi:outer membrane protein insertion porin family
VWCAALCAIQAIALQKLSVTNSSFLKRIQKLVLFHYCPSCICTCPNQSQNSANGLQCQEKGCSCMGYQMKIRTWLPTCWSFCAVLMIFATVANAQGPQGPPPGGGGPAEKFVDNRPQFIAPGKQILIVRVDVKGNQTVARNRIDSYLQTRKDRAFDPAVLQADVRSLVTSNLFRDVRTFTERVDGGVVVSFEVFERPSVSTLRFIGNRGISDKTLRKQLSFAAGDALNLHAVNEGVSQIENLYREKGYSLVRVHVAKGLSTDDREVIYEISEGNRARIHYTSFVGNTIVSGNRLMTQVRTKPLGGMNMAVDLVPFGSDKPNGSNPVTNLIPFGGDFDQSILADDVEKLTEYYRSLGFLNARVGREVEFSDDGEKAYITFVIDEGARYFVRNVEVLGAKVFRTDDLVSRMKMNGNGPFSKGENDWNQRKLKEIYGGQGYIFADVKADILYLDGENAGKVDLVYTVQEGEQFRVGRVNVEIVGENPHTQESVILNRVTLQPGDVIDIRQIEKTKALLNRSQLFVTNPAQGKTPQVVVVPPEFDEASRYASNPTFRGQSPSMNQSPAAQTNPAYQPSRERLPNVQVNHRDIVDVRDLPPEVQDRFRQYQNQTTPRVSTEDQRRESSWVPPHMRR